MPQYKNKLLPNKTVQNFFTISLVFIQCSKFNLFISIIILNVILIYTNRDEYLNK